MRCFKGLLKIVLDVSIFQVPEADRCKCYDPNSAYAAVQACKDTAIAACEDAAIAACEA